MRIIAKTFTFYEIERNTHRSRPSQLQALVAYIQTPNRSSSAGYMTHVRILVRVCVSGQIRVPTLLPMGASRRRLLVSPFVSYRKEIGSSSEAFLAR